MTRIFRPNAYFEEEIVAQRLSPRKLHFRNSILESAFLILESRKGEGRKVLVHSDPEENWVSYWKTKGTDPSAAALRYDSLPLSGLDAEPTEYSEWGNISRWQKGIGPVLYSKALEVSRRISSKIRQNTWREEVGLSEFPSLAIFDALGWEKKKIRNREFLDSHERFVIKTEFGFAGASSLCSGSEIDSRIREIWSQRKENLLLEPWMDRLEDFSLLFEARGGALRIETGTILLSDAEGKYSGTWIGKSDRIESYLSEMREIPEKLRSFAENYEGFGSIDSFYFRTKQETNLRKVSEINFRWTMGRILWELRRLVSPTGYSDLLLFFPKITVSDAYDRVLKWERETSLQIHPLAPFYSKGKPRQKNLVWIRVPETDSPDPWKEANSIFEQGFQRLSG